MSCIYPSGSWILRITLLLLIACALAATSDVQASRRRRRGRSGKGGSATSKLSKKTASRPQVQLQADLSETGDGNIHIGHSSTRDSKVNVVQSPTGDTKAAISISQFSYMSIPLALTIAVMAVVLSTLNFCKKLCDDQEATCLLVLPANVIMFIAFTVVIPNSYDLCSALGMGASFSGAMVGIFMLGTCVGQIIMYACIRVWPDIWRKPRLTMATSLALTCVGMSLYTLVALHVDGMNASEWLLYLLLGARILSGVGLGLWTQMASVLFKHLVPPEELPYQMPRLSIANTIGIGFGPFLASGAAMACPNSKAGFAVDGAVTTIMCVVALCGLPYMLPSSAEQEDCITDSSPEEKNSHRSRPDLLICACLFNIMTRAYVVSGVEVASAFLLQEAYLWNKISVGLAIGGTFLLASPVKIIYDAWKGKFSITTWMRSLVCLSLGGCWLLRGNGWQILIGDALIFSSMYMCDGIIGGLMLQGVSALDTNLCVLGDMIVSNVGRLLGPWLARMCIESKGQETYALMQITACLTFTTVYECVINRIRIA